MNVITIHYYDLTEAQRLAMNLDYDLGVALKCNPQSYDLTHIERVLAVVEGERDERDWHWVLRLTAAKNPKRYVYVTGGCDYTGWD